MSLSTFLAIALLLPGARKPASLAEPAVARHKPALASSPLTKPAAEKPAGTKRAGTKRGGTRRGATQPAPTTADTVSSAKPKPAEAHAAPVPAVAAKPPAVKSGLAPGPGGPPARYEGPVRVRYIDQALDAVSQTQGEALDQAYHYAAAMERGGCSAQMERLRVECLMTSARRYCRSKKNEAKRCTLYMDVIIANVLAERQLVTATERYELMRQYKDHRAELARHLLRLRGSLAADFRLAAGAPTTGAALATAVDTYCRTTADVSNLTYQTCVASLVWFIGRTS